MIFELLLRVDESQLLPNGEVEMQLDVLQWTNEMIEVEVPELDNGGYNMFLEVDGFLSKPYEIDVFKTTTTSTTTTTTTTTTRIVSFVTIYVLKFYY